MCKTASDQGIFDEKNIYLRDIYPIELIKTGIKVLQQARSRNEKEAWRALIVYQIIPIKNMLLPLGRDYKPLGLEGDDKWVNYEDYDFLLIPPDRVNIELLYADGILTHGYYFFNDRTYPDNTKNKKRYIDLISKVFDGKK